MEAEDRQSQRSEEDNNNQSCGELFYAIAHLALLPINIVFYITVWILMIDKTIIFIPIIVSIIALFFQWFLACAIMDGFKGTHSKRIAKVFNIILFCWITKLFQKYIKPYYIWYNVVWVLTCLCPNFTMLALPIDGYSKYTTEEILLVYAYILMAYFSTVIYILSFLSVKHGSLSAFIKDWTNSSK